MAAPSHATAALACMQEIQAQCFRLGIPLRTRHREVAPNQYEFAPLFGTATTQIDQNLVVMQASDAAQTMNLNLTLSRRWRRRDASTPSMRPRESLRVS